MGNNLHQLSDMPDFKGPETPGNQVLNFVVLFLEFLPYIGFCNENPLYETVRHTHEQKKYTLQCVSHICCGQQIKLDCVTNMLQCCLHDN